MEDLLLLDENDARHVILQVNVGKGVEIMMLTSCPRQTICVCASVDLFRKRITSILGMLSDSRKIMKRTSSLEFQDGHHNGGLLYLLTQVHKSYEKPIQRTGSLLFVKLCP